VVLKTGCQNGLLRKPEIGLDFGFWVLISCQPNGFFDFWARVETLFLRWPVLRVGKTRKRVRVEMVLVLIPTTSEDGGRVACTLDRMASIGAF